MTSLTFLYGVRSLGYGFSGMVLTTMTDPGPLRRSDTPSGSAASQASKYTAACSSGERSPLFETIAELVYVVAQYVYSAVKEAGMILCG